MSQLHPRLQKARIGLILDAPFFGSLITRLDMIEDEKVPTFCTNGVNIRYSPKFLATLTDEEVKGVLAHEVAHCALGHLWRMDSRHPLKWNVATDYAINQLLDDYAQECRQRGQAVPWTLPKGGLLDKSLGDKSSEEIYRLLPEVQEIMLKLPAGGGASCGEFEKPPSEGKGKGNGNGDKDGKGGGSGADGDEKGPAGAESGLEADWQIATVQAATVAKMQGNCPASIQRLIDEIVNPKVPWREVLREFIRRRARDDYSFRKPNRRYLQQGVILPGMYSERMGPLVCAVDTSGSIDAHTLAEFQAEIQCALDECLPERVEVVVCDAAVHVVQTFEPGEKVRIDAKGGGGTDFRPVFEHIAKNHDEDPTALIYLTDLYGSFPASAPSYPVLWAALGHGNQKPPFGELVAIK